MEVVRVTLKNNVFLHIDCDRDIMMEIKEKFTFSVPGAKYTPAFKFGGWDGTISLFNIPKQQLYAGVFLDLDAFCTEREYKLECWDSGIGLPNQNTEVLPEEMVEFVKSLEIPNIEVRDYQYAAIYKAIRNKRHTILSSTGSGKSLVIYVIVRYLLDELDYATLIVVPTTTLVHQLTGDFADYGFDVEQVHKIMSGLEKNTKKKVVISTWQSLVKMPKEWFDRFKCVVIDECHGAKATELNKLLEKCTESEYRFGMTGSLDDSKSHKMMIQGVLGPVLRVSDTKTLQDQGHLADIDIKCIVLDYTKDTKVMMRGQEYHKEVDFIVSHTGRNKFICNLAAKLTGNTLILYTFVEKHGDVLDAILKDKLKEGSYFYVHGGVDGDDRNNIRAIVEKHDNAVILASMGTFSTGINIKRLHNLVIVSPVKSIIRVLQSIGRGLRKGDGKDKLMVYDLADDLANSKTKKNFAYKHFVNRLEIYSREQFPYTITTVPIE